MDETSRIVARCTLFCTRYSDIINHVERVIHFLDQQLNPAFEKGSGTLPKVSGMLPLRVRSAAKSAPNAAKRVWNAA